MIGKDNARQVARALLVYMLSIPLLAVGGLGIPVALLAEVLLFRALRAGDGALEGQRVKQLLLAAIGLDAAAALAWLHEVVQFTEFSHASLLPVPLHVGAFACLWKVVEVLADESCELDRIMGFGDRYRRGFMPMALGLAAIVSFVTLGSPAVVGVVVMVVGMLKFTFLISLFKLRRVALRELGTKGDAPPAPWMRGVGFAEIVLGPVLVVGATAWLLPEWEGWGYHSGEHAIIPPVIAGLVAALGLAFIFAGAMHARLRRAGFFRTSLAFVVALAAYLSVCHLPAAMYWRQREASLWSQVAADNEALVTYYRQAPGHLWRPEAIDRFLAILAQGGANWIDRYRISSVLDWYHRQAAQYDAWMAQLKPDSSFEKTN